MSDGNELLHFRFLTFFLLLLLWLNYSIVFISCKSFQSKVSSWINFFSFLLYRLFCFICLFVCFSHRPFLIHSLCLSFSPSLIPFRLSIFFLRGLPCERHHYVQTKNSFPLVVEPILNYLSTSLSYGFLEVLIWSCTHDSIE